LYTLRQLKQVRKATGVLRPRNMLLIYQALDREAWMLAREIALKSGRSTSETAKYLTILARLGYAERTKIKVMVTSGGECSLWAYRRNGRNLVA